MTNIDAKGTVQLLEDDITWDGFTIRGVPNVRNGPGMYTSPAHSGYLVRDTIFLDNGFGMHLGSDGKHPTLVCRNRFTANNEFEGPGGANGVYSDEGAQQVLITSNLFEGHNGAADLLRRRAVDQARQRDVLIEDNKSVDDLSFATIFNSNRVRVTSNWIRARVGDAQFPRSGLGDLHRRPQRRHRGPEEQDQVGQRQRHRHHQHRANPGPPRRRPPT